MNHEVPLPRPVFGTMMVSLTFYGKIIEILEFQQPEQGLNDWTKRIF